MKTFKRFLNESMEYENTISEIISKAGPFLREEPHTIEDPLLRGMKSLYEYTVKVVRKNRRPLDTPRYVHEKVDDYFEREYGIRFRSNVIFATGSPWIARQYGDVYAIFPIGRNYSYLWSEHAADLKVYLENAISMNMGEDMEGLGDGDPPDSIKDELDRTIELSLEEADYHHDTGLEQALSDSFNPEIMLHCDEYIAVEKSHYHNLKPRLMEQMK